MLLEWTQILFISIHNTTFPHSENNPHPQIKRLIRMFFGRESENKVESQPYKEDGVSKDKVGLYHKNARLYHHRKWYQPACCNLEIYRDQEEEKTW